MIDWKTPDVILVLLEAVQLVPGSPLSTGGHNQKRMCVSLPWPHVTPRWGLFVTKSLQSDQKYICAVRITYRGADNICLITDSNGIRVRRLDYA